jgi:hypothetical protein
VAQQNAVVPASVARRLESLGALTRGDRRAAAGSSDMAQFNFDTKHGQAALKQLVIAIAINKYPPTGVELSPIIKGTSMAGMDITEVHNALHEALNRLGFWDEANPPVTRFLNRLLGAPVATQEILFAYFTAAFDQDILQAKRSGTFDEGVSDIKGTITLVGDPKTVFKNDALNLETKLYSLEVDRGLSFEVAKETLEGARAEDAAAAERKKKRQEAGDQDDDDDYEDDDLDGFIEDDDAESGHQMGFYRSKKKVFGAFIHLLAIEKKVDGRSKAIVARPNTGTNKNGLWWSEINRNYSKYENDEKGWSKAEADWGEEYARGGEKGTSKVKRSYKVGVLAGSVTAFWGTLQDIMNGHPELYQHDAVLQVVRLELPVPGDAAASGAKTQRIVGVKWPAALADEVAEKLKTAAAGKADSAPPVEPPTDVDAAAPAKPKAKEVPPAMWLSNWLLGK